MIRGGVATIYVSDMDRAVSFLVATRYDALQLLDCFTVCPRLPGRWWAGGQQT